MKSTIFSVTVSLLLAVSANAASSHVGCQAIPGAVSASANGDIRSQDLGHGHTHTEGAVAFTLYSANGDVLFHDDRMGPASAANAGQIWLRSGTVSALIEWSESKGSFYRDGNFVMEFATSCSMDSGHSCHQVGHAIQCH